MANIAKKLEGVKQEVRSVLLTQPNGLTVTSFLSDYRSMVGQNLPFRELGYSSPDEFLRSIPSVVSMNWSLKYNTYMLKAVADATTKHIEKLVSKQKNSKSATLASRRIPSGVPPRFNKSYSNKSSARPYLPVHVKNDIYNLAREFKSGSALPVFLAAFRKKYGKDLVFKNYGFWTLEDCLNSIPEVFLRCESNEMRVYPIIEKRAEENSTAVHQDSLNSVQNSTSSNNNDNKENEPANTVVNDRTSFMAFSSKSMEDKTLDILDNFSSPEATYGISSTLREQFKQIMKKNPQGIWVSQFSETLLKFAGYKLDHRKLGYYNLVDLFNDIPEIFRIEVFDDCKDDWMLFDATGPGANVKPEKGSEGSLPSGTVVSNNTFEVVQNIRLLLQANSEGINFDEFCCLYEANCDERFDLNELGFDSLYVFLESIAERVPLKIDYSRKKPRVCYRKDEASQAISGNASQNLELSADIPADAVVGCTEYKLQKIPDDLNPENFFPVYLTSAFDPSHIYIQLRGDDTSMLLENLMEELEFFYYKKEGEWYRMPKHYIMSGVVCAAIWPSDGRWHRIQISSVPSSGTIVAFFVDFGTKERIPSDDLRFLKKKFMELPAQAIRSHLCRLRPSHGDSWDPKAKDLILSSFGTEPLMACLAKRPVGEESLPLVLCDVSGQNDVYVNDLLVTEGFAKYTADEHNNINKELPGHHLHCGTKDNVSSVNNQKQQISPASQQEHVDHLLADGEIKDEAIIYARREAESSEVPVLPENVSGNFLHMMSLINTPAMRNFNNVQDPSNPVLNLLNNFSNGELASLHPLLQKQIQTLESNNSMLNQPVMSYQSQHTGNFPGPNFHPSSMGFYGHTAPITSHQISHESDSEVFESDEEIDDDDNPEVNSISKRFVKRVNLDDGYNHVHMIVIDDRPYMSSGDITYLLWSHDDPNFVRRKLKSKEISIPTNTVHEVGYEQLFYQLERFQVKGVKTEVNGGHCITLFPFKNVVDILNIFGHPSVAVRDIIDNELLYFDPSDSFWKTISEEEFEGNFVCAETNVVKEQKVSLYELKASLQALKFRKQTLKNQLYSSTSIPSLGDEIEKIEIQCLEVEKQIRELQVKVVSYQREKGFD